MPGKRPTPEKHAVVLGLRIRGATLQQIADELGYANRSSVAYALEQALKEEVGDLAAKREQYRAELVLQIEAATRALAPKVSAGDVRAVDAWTRLMDRKARLLGLDAPTKVVVTDTMDAEIEALLEEERRLAVLASQQEQPEPEPAAETEV